MDLHGVRLRQAVTHQFDDHRLIRLAVRRLQPLLVWAVILFGWIMAIVFSPSNSAAFVYFAF